ncbi:MAG: GAF domain-containing protein, partial [Anaerolineae bacterium]
MVERFQHLFDSLTEAVVTIDQDLRITFANPAWIRQVGLSPSQIIGKRCYQVLRKATTPCAPELCPPQKVFQTGQPNRSIREDCQSQDHVVEISASPVFDSAGRVVEVLQISHTVPAPSEGEKRPRSPDDERTVMRGEVADALRTVALLAASGQSLSAVLDAILEQLGRVVNYDSASIALLEERGWRTIAGRGFPPNSDVIGFVLPADDEKAARMEQMRQPMIIRDVQEDPQWLEVPGTGHIRSWIGAPLLAQGRMLGTLNLDKTEPGYYQPEDALLVMTFANQAAVVIENARLLEAERQRAAQLRLVSDIGQQALSILDPEALLDYAAQAIQSQFGYYCVDVFLTEPQGEYVVFRTSSHPQYAARWHDQNLRLRIGEEGIVGYVAATGEAYLANDVGPDPHYISDVLLPETRSELAVPIKVGERVIGVLDINSERLNVFGDNDLFVSQSLADQLAIGLENARLYKAAQQRVAELEAVRQVGLGLTSRLELGEALETILDSTMGLLKGARDAHIFLYQDDRLRFGAALWADGHKGTPWAEPRPHGLTHTVARQGETIVVPDMRTHPLFADAPSDWEGAIIGLPLKIGQQVVGVMSIAYQQAAGSPSEAQLRILHLLADQAAIVIENARLFKETSEHVAHLETKTRDLELVHQVSGMISSSLDLTHILETTVEQMVQVFEADHSGIMLFDYDQRQGHVVAEYPAAGATAERLPLEGYLAAERLIREQEPLRIEDAQNDPLMAGVRETMERFDIRSMLIVPLIAKGEVVGSIGLDAVGHQRRFNDSEVALAQTIANQVASAIENARLYQETQQRLKELRHLFQTSAAVSGSLYVDQVVLTTAQHITHALEAEGCAIYVWDRKQDVLVNQLDYSTDPSSWKPEPQGTPYPLIDYPITRKVLMERQPRVIRANDPEAEPTEVAWMRAEGVASLLMVPLVMRDKVIGLLELMECQEERTFTATEVSLCQTLANQAAAALENARLFEETGDRVRELAALAAVGQAMTTLELDDVLDSIAKNAQEAAQAEISSVYLLDEEQQRLVPRSVRGMQREQLEQGIFDLGEGTIGQVALSGEPLMVPDINVAKVFVPKSEAAQQIHNTLTVPLAVKGRVIGTLEVCNKIGESEFTATDQRLLTAFAAQAAVAIDNARLYQEVSQHLQEVLVLNKVARAATATLDFDKVIQQGVTALLGMRNFERVNILLLDRERDDLFLHPALRDSNLFPQRADVRIPLGQGIAGRVAQEGTPMRVDDVREEPNYIEGYPDTLSELCVPLKVGDRIIGVLDAQSTKLGAFSESDQRLLSTLSGQLSTTLDNIRLFEETEQRVRELAALTDVSQALNEAQDLVSVLDIVLDKVLELVGGKECLIILIDPPNSDQLRIVGERGWSPEDVEKFNKRPVYTHEGTFKRALQKGRMVEVPDTASDPDFLRDVGSQATEITHIPLMTERGSIGLISVDRLPGDETTQRLLTTLASMAAAAIDKEQLHLETSDRL